MTRKSKRNWLLFHAILALAAWGCDTSQEKMSEEKDNEPSYTWAGIWQPMRVSAGDGITELDVKIGRFINLSSSELKRSVNAVSARFQNSTPWILWAVGDMSELIPAHEGLTDEEQEQYLTIMDTAGVSVYLEIFPRKDSVVDVATQIDYWLSRYKHHTCIKGLGIDLEYFTVATDQNAAAWNNVIKSHNLNYRMFLRHYNPDYMPPTFREDVIFINNGSEASVEALSSGFAKWANRFYPAACAFQLGYPADEDAMDGDKSSGWWTLKAPVADWGKSILTKINNADQELGIVWVTARSGKSYNRDWSVFSDFTTHF